MALLTISLLMLVVACGPSGPTGVPAPPRDVVATAIAGGINVNWIDQSSDEQGFIILRKAAGTDGPPTEEVGRVATDEIAFNDFPTEKDGAYVYAVQSFNVIGPSDPVTQSPGDPVSPLPGVDVTITFDGDGTVVVSGGPVSKTCASDCLVAFAAGTDVTFSAQSAEGVVFAGWAGDCSGAGTCAIEINEPLEVEARFRKHVLQLSLAGDSPVRLTMYPADDFGNIQCELGPGEACALAYGFAGPLAVSINAEKLDPAGTFEGFDGPCTTTAERYCLVNVSGATAIAVQSVHPPVAADDAYSLLEDEQLVVASPGVLANDSDTPDDTLSAVLVDGPSNGQLDLAADGSFSYTPNQDFHGSDSFTYMARDAYGSASGIVTVTLSVTAVNDPPVFDLQGDLNYGVADGHPGVVNGFASGIGRGGGSDEDGQTVAFTVTRESGSLAPMTNPPAISPTGALTYLPAVGSFGSATYSVTLKDSGGGSDTSSAQSFTIEVDSLTLTRTVVGQGTISSTPPSASGEYGWGTVVHMTATPETGHTFKGWTGACDGTNLSCNVPMNQDSSVSARFDPQLTVAFSSTGFMIVNSDPAGISNCNPIVPTGCRSSFQAGSQVTLSVSNNPDAFNFSNVECAAAEPTTACTFSMPSGPVTVTLSPPPLPPPP